MTATSTDMTSFTVAQFVVMGIFALLAVAGILFGMRLKRRRLAAQEETEEHREAAGVPAVTTEAAPKETARVAPGVTDDSTAPIAALAPPALPADISQPDAAPGATSTTNDIRQMKGLGPKLAATLAELGITRVAQIAAMSPAELEDLDSWLGTFRGRPARDRWAEQARLLTAGDKAAYEAAFGKLGN